jgi:hypothetical protein
MRGHVLDMSKPFRCDYPKCRYVATQGASSDLCQHRQTHAGKSSSYAAGRVSLRCDRPGCDLVVPQGEPHLIQQRSMMVHTETEERPYYQCQHPYCDYASGDLSHLSSHMKTHRGASLLLRCNHQGCGFVASRSDHLVRHAVVHEKSGPFSSHGGDGDRAVSKPGELAIARTQSLQESPYRCGHPGCGYESTVSSTLTRHMRTHVGSTPLQYDGPSCKLASAARPAQLAAHGKMHAGEKPYKCSHVGCNYETSRSGNLSLHIMTHTGEKPFKCTHPGCKYAAIQSSALTTHIRTHTGEKPFKCNHLGCGYASAVSSSLTRHMRTHTGERPFKCEHPGCGYAATVSSHLTKHRKTHPKEWSEKQSKRGRSRLGAGNTASGSGSNVVAPATWRSSAACTSRVNLKPTGSHKRPASQQVAGGDYRSKESQFEHAEPIASCIPPRKKNRAAIQYAQWSTHQSAPMKEGYHEFCAGEHQSNNNRIPIGRLLT